jgi:hypothetical protein
MEPLKHYLKISKHRVFPHWNLVVWLNLVTAHGNEPTWNIFLSETVCKSAGKTSCLLLWAPCHGSIWRIVCITSHILHCGIRWRLGLASCSDRLDSEEKYTVPIEELTVMTAGPVWAVVGRQNLLPFLGTEPKSVGRRARGLTAISHYPFQLPKDCVFMQQSMQNISVSWEAWRKQVFVLVLY